MLKIDWTRRVGGVPNTPAHYNGAPGQDYLVARVHPETKDLTLDLIRWGLLPNWAKDRKIAWRMINARAETVATMPAFKRAFAMRRCLLPVDGFYEWRTRHHRARGHFSSYERRRRCGGRLSRRQLSWRSPGSRNSATG
jgi:putative SOS response-associated peptidase YedK